MFNSMICCVVMINVFSARIGGGGELVTELSEVSERVLELGAEARSEDELLEGAPEEFLDPIMSTLMTDPVILPSSRITIDRSTIARYSITLS
jgi:hypothetical protein